MRGLSAQLSRGIALVLVMVMLVAGVLLILELTTLRPRYEAIQAEDRARSQVVQVAEQFTVQVNNYDVASINQYQSRISTLLSPKFKAEFDKAMTDIVSSVKQAKMTSQGRVLAAAVSNVDPDSATVLVVSDAAVKTVFDPSVARHFRWEVDLVKINDRWLVDNFTPVA